MLAVPVASDEAKDAVRQILLRHGAHFMDFYGRFVTEGMEVWRGPELDISEPPEALIPGAARSLNCPR